MSASSHCDLIRYAPARATQADGRPHLRGTRAGCGSATSVTASVTSRRAEPSALCHAPGSSASVLPPLTMAAAAETAS